MKPSTSSTRWLQIAGAALAIFIAGIAGGWLLARHPSSLRQSRRNASPPLPPGIMAESAESNRNTVHPLDSFTRVRESGSVADSLDSAGVQEALDRAWEGRGSGHEKLIGELLARWGEIDPQAAMQYALSLADATERSQAVNAVLNGWVEHDLSAAEKWVTEIKDGILKSSALETLIGAAAVTNPEHAFELAQGMDLKWPDSRRIAELVVDEWAGRDPKAAAGFVSGLPESEMRSAALLAIAARWAEVNAHEAITWAESLPDQNYEARPVGVISSSPIYSVLEAWMMKDSTGALSWLRQIPDEQKRTALAASACGFLRDEVPNPEAAAMQLAMLFPAGAQRDNALESLAQDVARVAPASALAWIREQTDPKERQVVLSGVLSRLSGADLEAALQLAQNVDAEARANLISIESIRAGGGGTFGWTLSDPATLAAWALRQPNNEESINRIARSWIRSDPDKAAEWIQTLPAAARDKAIQGHLDQALSGIPVDTPFDSAAHFQKTERWITLLSDPAARKAAYERFARRFMDMDPGAAREWISRSSLPAEVKSKLLK